MYSQLLRRIVDYLSGKISLAELEQWVVLRLPTLYSPPFAAIWKLVDEIESGLMEIDEGVIDEADFKRRLGQKVSAVPIIESYPESTRMVTTSSSSPIFFGLHNLAGQEIILLPYGRT